MAVTNLKVGFPAASQKKNKSGWEHHCGISEHLKSGRSYGREKWMTKFGSTLFYNHKEDCLVPTMQNASAVASEHDANWVNVTGGGELNVKFLNLVNVRNYEIEILIMYIMIIICLGS